MVLLTGIYKSLGIIVPDTQLIYMKLHFSILIITVVLTLLPAGGIQGEDILIKASEYTSSYNISGNPISGSQGYLTGLDFEGEWVEYQISPREFGTSNAELSVVGELYISYELKLTLIPEGVMDSQNIYYEFTGNGYG